MNRYLLAIGLALLPLFVMAQPSGSNDKRLHVVMSPLLGSELTRAKFLKLLAEWRELTGHRVEAFYTNDPDYIAKGCREQSIDFFMTSLDKALTVMAQCDYTVVAELDTAVHLYTLKGKDMSLVKIVGATPDNSSYNIAKRTLSGYQFRDFSSYTTAFFALQKGEVDAVAASPALYLPMAHSIAAKVEARRKLADDGKGAVLFSARFEAMPEADLIRREILQNSPSVKEIFVETFGFSPWYAPDSR